MSTPNIESVNFAIWQEFMLRREREIPEHVRTEVRVIGFVLANVVLSHLECTHRECAHEALEATFQRMTAHLAIANVQEDAPVGYVIHVRLPQSLRDGCDFAHALIDAANSGQERNGSCDEKEDETGR